MILDTMQERIQEIVATIFNVPVETVNLESSPATIESWDSMGHLMLVLELEQQFDIQLGPEEVEKLSSVQNIVNMLQSKEAA
jgi:acyl carrier protein